MKGSIELLFELLSLSCSQSELPHAFKSLLGVLQDMQQKAFDGAKKSSCSYVNPFSCADVLF